MKKELLKNIVLALALSVVSCTAYAQAEPGTADNKSGMPEEVEPQTEIFIEDDEDVDTMISNFLSEKNWNEGLEGNYTKDGKPIYVAVGTAQISASKDDKNYIAARINAYNKALLSAKDEMVKYIENTISTETEYNMFSDESDEDSDESSKGANVLTSKVKVLLESELDKALEKNGVDLSNPSEQEVKKVLNSADFKKKIRTFSEAQIAGLQVYKTFEYVPANKNGRVGVVAIWTERLFDMANVMVAGGDLPIGIPKKPIREQIATDTESLLTSFGVKQLLDEKGNLVLVSFGQAGAKSNSDMSLEVAKKQSKTYAEAAIREFAGENIVRSSAVDDNESYLEYVDETDEVAISNSFESKIKAKADDLKISGISTLKTAKVRHPITGKYVCICVCSWSPKSAMNAQEFGKKMQSVGKVKSSSPAQPKVQKKVEKKINTTDSFEGSSQEADDDAL